MPGMTDMCALSLFAEYTWNLRTMTIKKIMKLIPHHLFPSQRNIQLYIRMNEILLYSTCIYAQGSLNRSLDPSGSMTYSQGTIKFLKIFLF